MWPVFEPDKGKHEWVTAFGTILHFNTSFFNFKIKLMIVEIGFIPTEGTEIDKQDLHLARECPIRKPAFKTANN
jgi:hypothetical protein